MTNEAELAGHLLSNDGIECFSVIIARERAERRKTAPRGLVYLVTGDHPDAVKIGFTTDLSARLAHLQTGMATDIFLAACFEGSVFDERDLQERFARYRMRGEWFALKKPVVAKIESLRRASKVRGLIIRYQPWQGVK